MTQAPVQPEAESTALAKRERLDLSTYSPAQYNVLSATGEIVSINPLHMTTVSKVKLSPIPDDGDFYKQGSRNVAPRNAQAQWQDVLVPTKVALLKMADAAGIVWDMDRTMRVDDRSNRDYCEFQAVGGIKMPDGSTKWLKGTKEIDMLVISEEIERDWQEKIDTEVGYGQKRHKVTKAEAEGNARRDILAFRKNMVARCETGAMNRVIRALMKIKTHYSPAEADKLFVIPRIDFAPGMNDPAMRQLQIQAAQKALSSMYAPPSATTPAPEAINADFRAVDVPADDPEPVPAGEDDEPETIEGTVVDPEDTDDGGDEFSMLPSQVAGEEETRPSRSHVVVEMQELAGSMGWDKNRLLAFLQSEFPGIQKSTDLSDEQLVEGLAKVRKQKAMAQK